ncbi:MAG TPA: hypothetical protein VF999_05695 [Thermoanaerobaculia bacterium]
MPQTRMFRDRVVSMEQTLEGGEKHLDLLKALCREALPELEYAGHFLDHERDLFVIELLGRDGRRKLVGWTRMVLFDSERIPILLSDPRSLLREKIVQHLRTHGSRPEIVVTFRHLEEGWTDTPEPRRDRRRRRRGRGEARRAGGAEKSAARPRVALPAPSPKLPRSARPATTTSPAPPPQTVRPPEAGRPEGRERHRRRFRRRRRGRGTGGGGQPPPSSP